MKKLFVGQLIKGRTDEEILAVREKAIRSAEKQLGEPVEINNSFIRRSIEDTQPSLYLDVSLEFLSEADVAYFEKGWQESNRCRIENAYAIEHGILVIEDYTAD